MLHSAGEQGAFALGGPLPDRYTIASLHETPFRYLFTAIHRRCYCPAIMNPMRDTAAEAKYLRHFETLAKMAENLEISPDEAEELIGDILTSALVRRHIEDMDAWLAAAFTSAVHARGGSVPC